MSDKRIPVYLITGFLGSGKTTVLLQMIKYFKDKGLTAGVVLNELGEVNVEKDLFSNDEPMLEMLNGCICCTIQEDLKQELSSFLEVYTKEKKQLDVILIEGTGIANPSEVVEALTHPDLMNRLQLQSIISLIDASRFLDYLSIFSSSKEIRTVLKQQVTNSSLLILNKVDLVNEKKLEKVMKKMVEMTNGQQEVVKTSYGEVSIDLLLKERVQTTTVSLKQPKQANDDHHHHDHHEHHHHPHLFQAIKLDDVPVLDRVAFQKWLQGLPETVVRAKGIIQLTETPQPFQFQYSSGQLQLVKVDRKNFTNTCIIIIGHQLAVEEIRQSFIEVFIDKKMV